MIQFYHSYLQSSLTKSEFLIFKILIDLLQIHQWVRLESLAVSLSVAQLSFHCLLNLKVDEKNYRESAEKVKKE